MTTTPTTTLRFGTDVNVLKFILIGNTGVGKTSILQRYMDGRFSESVGSTIGLDFEVKMVQVEGHAVTLHLWDTAGQEKFRNVVAPFYRNADVVILVYDITNMDSFIGIESWFDEVQHYNTSSSLGLLVGNKCDLVCRRVVGPEMAVGLANRLGMPYVETSAKDCTNVCELFSAMAEATLQRRMETDQASPVAHDAADKINIESRSQQKSCSQCKHSLNKQPKKFIS